MYMLRICIILAILSISIQGECKETERTIELWGHVKDAFTKSAIRDVYITLMTEDSIFVDSMHVNYYNEGSINLDAYYKFDIPAKPAVYIIKAEHPNYYSQCIRFEIKHVKRNTYFDVPYHYLKRKPTTEQSIELEEVEVKATKIKMVVKGDTIVYNADAFSVPYGSMLDALIEQLPGVTLTTNGEIYRNNHKVEEILVNGKNFYKKNPKAVIENLPYYSINKVAFYHRGTDKELYYGERNMERLVMDLELKKNYSHGHIFNSEIAGGGHKHYLDRNFLLKNMIRTRVSSYFGINNINEQKISPSSSGDWNPQKTEYGETTNQTGGIDIHWDNKNETISNDLSAYFIGYKDNIEERTSERVFLSADDMYNLSRKNGKGKYLFFSINDSWTMKKPVFVNLSAGWDYMKNTGHTQNVGVQFISPESNVTFDEAIDAYPDSEYNATFINCKKNRFSTRSYYSLIWSTADLAYKFPWGDHLDASVEAMRTFEHNHADKSYITNYHNTSIEEKYTQRKEYTPDLKNNYRGSLSYTVNLNGQWKHSLKYSIWKRVSRKHSDVYFFEDSIFASESLLSILPSVADDRVLEFDWQNSYHSRNRLCEQSWRYSIEYKSDKLVARIHLPIYYRHDNLRYKREMTDTIAKRTYTYMAPEMSLSYKFNKTDNLFVRYTCLIKTPDLLKTIHITDASNPLVIYEGNPQLHKCRSHVFHVEQGIHRQPHQAFFNASADINIEESKIANAVHLNTLNGTYIYKPYNISGNWNGKISFAAGSSFGKQQTLSWEVNTKYLLVNNKDIISTKDEKDEHTQTVKNHLLDGTIKLTYHRRGLRINLFGKLEWRRLNNIEGETTCLNMYGDSYGCVVNCQLPWKISFSPSIKYYRWHGYSANYMNQSSCIADVTISKLLLKEKIVIKIIGNDLFHQISNRKYVVNGQGQVETIYNRPPNYIMVSIGYRFDSITK